MNQLTIAIPKNADKIIEEEKSDSNSSTLSTIKKISNLENIIKPLLETNKELIMNIIEKFNMSMEPINERMIEIQELNEQNQTLDITLK
jgi:hypothetical protein